MYMRIPSTARTQNIGCSNFENKLLSHLALMRLYAHQMAVIDERGQRYPVNLISTPKPVSCDAAIVADQPHQSERARITLTIGEQPGATLRTHPGKAYPGMPP